MANTWICGFCGGNHSHVDCPSSINAVKVEHKPLPVAGYTSQSSANTDLANEGKELEERYLRWLDKLAQANLSLDCPPDIYDRRCLAEARTCIQTGAMWAIRAIFKPQRIKLPEDGANDSKSEGT